MEKNHLTLSIILLLFISSIVPLNVVAQSTTLSMNPDSFLLTEVNETFEVDLKVNNVQDLWGWTTAISWNPEFLSFEGACTEGDFLNSQGSTFFVSSTPGNGYIQEISCMYLLSASASGSGVLAHLKFKVLKPCIEASINIENTTLLSPILDSLTTLHQVITQIEGPVSLAIVTFLGDSGLIAQAGGSQTVNEDTLVYFNASKTLPATDDLQYMWTFNDQGEKTLNGKIANYTFTKPGDYEINLVVQNSEGFQSTDTITIKVLDITAPIAVITLSDSTTGTALEHSKVIGVDKEIMLNAQDSYDPENGSLTGCIWDLGDGSPLIYGIPGTDLFAGRDFIISHSYTEIGQYTVTLTVQDQRANITGTKSMVLTVGTPAKETYSPSQNLSLPSYAFATIVGITIATICGSILWLNRVEIRKPKNFDP
jgi:hypothetical protein